jgi:L-aminopeptidase/D-esterase
MLVDLSLWLFLCCSPSSVSAQSTSSNTRPRASDLRTESWHSAAGPLNAITDVAGVEVGHTTIIRGDNVRTGVTAVLPHSGNLYRDKVPGAIFVGNGFGKLTGSTQVDEMGEIETPIVLTNTASVPRVADAVTTYILTLPGNENVLSVNPVVGETNDGYLNDIRGRHITPDDVFAPSRKRRPARLKRGMSELVRGPWRLVGREESELRRESCLRISVGTRSGF